MGNGNLSPQIVVVGSHIPGMFVRVKRAPLAGETVIGWDFCEAIDGGKGSNQAIAASKLGTPTAFVGCVGRDRIGEEGARWMEEAGVDLRYLYRSDTTSSGIGFIILNEDNIPAMVSTMGANQELSPAQVDQALAALPESRILLTQFEIRTDVALYATRAAQSRGLLTIVNPAPAVEVPLEDLAVADILVPNETEARLLLGYGVEEEIDPRRMVNQLRERCRVRCVIITLGEDGIIGADSSGIWETRPPSVKVVDTSGAGDVFCAGMAVGIINGLEPRQAANWGCFAATLSVTRPGTIPAFPDKSETEEFIQTFKTFTAGIK
jgi:ribokinase